MGLGPFPVRRVTQITQKENASASCAGLVPLDKKCVREGYGKHDIYTRPYLCTVL